MCRKKLKKIYIRMGSALSLPKQKSIKAVGVRATNKTTGEDAKAQNEATTKIEIE